MTGDAKKSLPLRKGGDKSDCQSKLNVSSTIYCDFTSTEIIIAIQNRHIAINKGDFNSSDGPEMPNFTMRYTLMVIPAKHIKMTAMERMINVGVY